MKTKAKNHTNYVDALENENHYAVLTKLGRIQILVQPTAKRLRKRGKRGWRLFGTVNNGSADASPILMMTIQRAIQEMENTVARVESKGTKQLPAKADNQ
ncbi:MAG TPA: hypothetical protein VKU02_06055 [Gemmataceae bacterium]|nr:hypothetical protein [Gemmataceae bacterium]